MDTSTANTHTAEQDRQERAAELNAENGANWAEDYRPGTFGCHELLDRTSLLANNLEEYVLSHPACVAHAEWYALADQAATALQELYQQSALHTSMRIRLPKRAIESLRRPDSQSDQTVVPQFEISRQPTINLSRKQFFSPPAPSDP